MMAVPAIARAASLVLTGPSVRHAEGAEPQSGG